MIQRLLVSSAVAALSTAAMAADLPSTKAPPPAPYVSAPIFTWTGFYIGGDVGGAWTNDGARYRTNPTFVPANPANTLFATSSMNASGVVGGLFAGYNYQFAGPLVIGVEADIEATSLSKTNANINILPPSGQPAGLFAFTNKESLPWQGSVRGRLGYAAGNALFYVTGGLAVAQINTVYLNPNFAGSRDSFTRTQTGWTVGGGIEYAFNANWTGRVEYRYSQFGTFKDTAQTTLAPAGAGYYSHSVSESAVRVGIAYKFGAPASAVVAKY